MTPKYEFTCLLVTNFKECFRFYQNVMGFRTSLCTENDTYADFEVGEVNISLFDKAEMSDVLGTSSKPVQTESQDTVCFTFSVTNVDDFCKHLQENGIPLLTQPTDHPDWGIHTVHFRDPNGNLIEVNQPSKRD